MVAGEFAVLEPNYHLIVMAVDRFVFTTIQDSEQNEVTLHDFELYQLQWEFVRNRVVFSSADRRLSFVQDAIATTLTYLKELNISPGKFNLSVRSELDDQESGLKYGLGSSAAVVTSLITAILTKFLDQPPSRDVIFKLAAISHIKTQGNGSGADIAASTFGGVLNYTSFQAEWLQEQLQTETSLVNLIQKRWDYLSIQPVNFPAEVQVCIGWTGSPASTGNLVSRILKLRDSKPEEYDSFLNESSEAVQLILDGMKSKQVDTFFTGIQQNREALAKLGEQAKVEIETAQLNKLSVVAEKFSGVGKLSGAGGGDCGIAFIPITTSCEQLHQAWEAIGITPLHLNLYPHGSKQVKDE